MFKIGDKVILKVAEGYCPLSSWEVKEGDKGIVVSPPDHHWTTGGLEHDNYEVKVGDKICTLDDKNLVLQKIIKIEAWAVVDYLDGEYVFCDFSDGVEAIFSNRKSARSIVKNYKELGYLTPKAKIIKVTIES
jgi:hypothetical protein